MEFDRGTKQRINPAMKTPLPANIENDIEAYKAACRDRSKLESYCGTDRARAVEKREERWATMTAKRVAAENLMMSVMVERERELRQAGLYDFYVALSNGEHGMTIFTIADQTVKAFS